MSNNVTAEQEKRVALSVQQLENIIRKVIREELMEYTSQEQGILVLNKESPLYEDLNDIHERKKINKLQFHTHEEVWNE
ncbi:MAG: hypothetical protein C4527_16160 [Candidatus Omnitrophota bacterium]|jgi:hypothetical protein|nr:MAG: hypothetical protein C4527_16160 [Candidatus Omnitrophota bacterium]